MEALVETESSAQEEITEISVLEVPVEEVLVPGRELELTAISEWEREEARELVGVPAQAPERARA